MNGRQRASRLGCQGSHWRYKCDRPAQQSNTPARHVANVAGAVPAVAQRLPQSGDMDAETALVDDDIGPNIRDQIPAANYFSGPACERDQNVERPAPQRKVRPFSFKTPFGREKAEWAKESASMPLGPLTSFICDVAPGALPEGKTKWEQAANRCYQENSARSACPQKSIFQSS